MRRQLQRGAEARASPRRTARTAPRRPRWRRRDRRERRPARPRPPGSRTRPWRWPGTRPCARRPRRPRAARSCGRRPAAAAGSAVARVHGPDRVDHPARRQVAGGRGHGLAGGQPVRQRRAAQLAAGLEDRRAAAPVDRAVHAAAAQQAAVRRVHHRVDRLLREVAPAARTMPRACGYRSHPMADLDLLVLGDANPDLVLRGGDVTPAFGQTERARGRRARSPSAAPARSWRAPPRSSVCARVRRRRGRRSVRPVHAATSWRRAGSTSAGSPSTPTGRPASPWCSRAARIARCSPRSAPSATSAAFARRSGAALVGAPRARELLLPAALAPGRPAVAVRRGARAPGTSTSIDPNWDPEERWDGDLLSLLSRDGPVPAELRGGARDHRASTTSTSRRRAWRAAGASSRSSSATAAAWSCAARRRPASRASRWR